MHTRAQLISAMRRALAISLNGPNDTANPQVGCVLLNQEGRIVSEGWHMGAGTPHAEVDALNHLPEAWRQRMGELTAVVTLEPCNHWGRTGPCAEALAESGIGHVVYALSDGGAESGGGAAKLRERGVRVSRGPLAAQAAAQLGWWIDQQPNGAEILLDAAASDTESSGVTGDAAASDAANTDLAPRTPVAPDLPIVIAKWAQTLDGRGAANDGTSQWITGPDARRDVHVRRAQADAILVGTGTLYADNPSLTARTADGELLVPAAEQPVPVVFGSREIPATARIRSHPAIAAQGLDDPLHYKSTRTPEELRTALRDLKQSGSDSVFVEGGPTLMSALIAAGVVSEFLIYTAPSLAGGGRHALADIGVPTIAQIRMLEVKETVPLGADTLVRAVPRKGGQSTCSPD